MSALDLLHGLVLDDGRRWGEVAVEWQRTDARAVLAPAEGEPRLHWIGRPKGGSKSSDLAGMSIAWLIEQAPPLAEGFAAASDKDQAARLLRRAKGFIARTPGLSSTLEVQANKIVNLRSGATVEALAADVAGSEGLLSPWIVVDELANWKTTTTARDFWTALFSGVEKVPGCRLIVITHAGDPAHWARKVFDDATAELGWRRIEVPGPLPWLSAKGLERQRRSLLPSAFARRHMNRWESGEDRLSSVDDVAACVRQGERDLEPQSGMKYIVSLDVGLTNDATVVSVAHLEDREAGRVVVLDRQAVWKGTKAEPVRLDGVASYIVQASRDYGRCALIYDPYQAAFLTQRLQKAGVHTIAFNFGTTSVGRLCVTLFRLLRDHLVELPDDAALIDELVNARVIERSPGVYRIDHDASRHDDRVIGLALAAQHLTDKPTSSRRGYLKARPGHPPAMPWGTPIVKPQPSSEPRKRGIRFRF